MKLLIVTPAFVHLRFATADYLSAEAAAQAGGRQEHFCHYTITIIV